MRLRATTSWARYDALFGAAGATNRTLRNLGFALSVDSLGPTQIPFLAAAEQAIRALTGNSSFHLSAGRIAAAANSRVVETPLVIEYGVSGRLTVGVIVPFVQTRTTLEARINSPYPCPPLKTLGPCPGGVQLAGVANVGPNPALTSPDALREDSVLVAQFGAAASALQSRLAQCQSNPMQTGCASLLARQADAQTLIQSSSAFAGSLATVYGSSSQTGQPFVPIAGGNEQATINQRIADFNARYRDFLGSDQITGAVIAAGGIAALRQVQALLTSGALAHDTLGPTDREGLGDISVGATLQVLNTFGDTARASAGTLRYRVAVNGTVRVGTGERPAPGRLYDIGTGTGQQAVIGSLAADVQAGRRVALSSVGSYTAQIGNIGVAARPPAVGEIFPLYAPMPGSFSNGNAFSVAAIPRLRITRELTLDGTYILLHQDPARFEFSTATTRMDSAQVLLSLAPYRATTAQQVGGGFSYSTLTAGDRGPGRIPAEVIFRHVETISGSGGPVAKVFEDRIELRLYYQR